MTDLSIERISTDAAPKPAGHYAQACCYGDLVFVSGQLTVSLDDKAAALLHSLTCNRPFADGNKRTAWVACEAFLIINDHRTPLTEDEAFDLVMRIATTCSEIEVKDIAQALRVA